MDYSYISIFTAIRNVGKIIPGLKKTKNLIDYCFCGLLIRVPATDPRTSGFVARNSDD
jgi:hypothetical protein